MTQFTVKKALIAYSAVLGRITSKEAKETISSEEEQVMTRSLAELGPIRCMEVQAMTLSTEKVPAQHSLEVKAMTDCMQK